MYEKRVGRCSDLNLILFFILLHRFYQIFQGRALSYTPVRTYTIEIFPDDILDDTALWTS